VRPPITSTQLEQGSAALPLRTGDRGSAVLDLQSRLAELDLPATDPPGVYAAATTEAVATFQRGRGLAASGVCEPVTWSALVEAGYRLGDRLLYRQAPMLRGDDVAELQRRLSALGFDPGRIDGIFGDDTTEAVQNFQRNAGLPVDGTCGRETVADLRRFQPPVGGADLVSPISERLRVHSGKVTLAGHRVAVGEDGGFMVGALSLSRALRERGATALELHDPDPTRQAATANAAGADCFVSLRIHPDRASCTSAYYRGFHYESVTSRSLAERLQAVLPGILDLDDGGTCGIALPILRETRMPAVELQLGRPTVVVQRVSALARGVVDCLTDWLAASA